MYVDVKIVGGINLIAFTQKRQAFRISTASSKKKIVCENGEHESMQSSYSIKFIK